MVKKIIAIPVFILIFIVSAYLTFTYLSGSAGNIKIDEKVEPTKEEVDYSKLEVENPDGYNFVLLGYGGKGHDGGYLTDVIIVIHIDHEDKKTTLVSIPRDLWVSVPVRSDISENYKINAAYAIGMDDVKYGLKEPQYRGDMGGGEMVKTVLSQVTGLNISNFIAVDFENFKNIIDKLGGVSVEVPVAFNDHFYPVKGLENETCGFSATKIADLHAKYSGFELEKQFTCRYEHLKFDKGLTEMDGEMALKFVRSRHSSEHGGDFARSQRQRAVLLAAEAKLLDLASAKNYPEVFEEFKNMITTDIDKSFVANLAKILGEPKDYEIRFASMSDENVLANTRSMNGQFILIPKEGEGIWNNVHKFVYNEIQR